MMFHRERNRQSPPRLLIVEDEPFIALALEEMLQELGFEVAGSLPRVNDALAFISHEHIDFALLDVNIGLSKIDPVADNLARLECPFVFITGYGRSGLPPAHSHRPVVEKPFKIDDLVSAIRTELEKEAVRS